MYGSSLATGATISNAFFWAINRSMDATLFHDWMFSRGNGLGAEYRYLLGPQAQGDFKYYWLDEKEAEINGGRARRGSSTTMNGGLSQNLPFGLSARGRVDYVTDVTVQQTYNHDFCRALQQQSQLSGGVSGAWRNLVGQRHRTTAPKSSGCRQLHGERPVARFHGGAERRPARQVADLCVGRTPKRPTCLHQPLQRQTSSRI